MMRAGVGLIALAGFALSLAVHLAARRGIDVESIYPAVFGLHIGAIVVFFPMAISMRQQYGARPKFREVFLDFPMPVLIVGALLFGYVIFNFVSSIGPLKDGSPSIEAGQYVLKQKGRFIRNLSEAEYTALRAGVMRAFSGHWLLFYYMPFAYFFFRRR